MKKLFYLLVFIFGFNYSFSQTTLDQWQLMENYPLMLSDGIELPVNYSYKDLNTYGNDKYELTFKAFVYNSNTVGLLTVFKDKASKSVTVLPIPVSSPALMEYYHKKLIQLSNDKLVLFSECQSLLFSELLSNYNISTK